MTTAISWIPKSFVDNPPSPSNNDAVHEVVVFAAEFDDMVIGPTDYAIVTARSVNDEHGLVEVWTFEDREYEDIEVHHDIQIEAFPLCMDFQSEERNFLAVGTTDTSIEIWDLNDVQAVAWNLHTAPWVLLSGSSDGTVASKDTREPLTSFTWPVRAGVKSLAWDPYCGFYFVASLEDGTVEYFDVRMAPASIFTLDAHTKAVTSVSYNQLEHNILATGSLDQTVKVWDLSNNQPTCIASKNPSVGDIFSISFSNDDRFMLAIGGKMGKLHIWDMSHSGIS
ncbi:hypothetical protein TSUD_119450 [Trifolium subterraneum]|uniref:Uncharacterized protein n=1 Tax=Trifolium subterraneum TaxID=3900 RepID=A0A2Z6N832_TRISU|nr:hypothetical protein TSUD_119450 [Trifolium subterraneum]